MATTEELLDRAHEHLALGEFELALDVAEELRALDRSAAHEVRALALASTGHVDEAAAGLEAAVSDAPDSWRLWMLLGNFACELGEPDRAHEAFERARTCSGAVQGVVAFDQAVLYEAQGELARAFDLLEGLGEQDDVDLATRLDALFARILTGMGMAERALELVDDRIEDSDGEGLEVVSLAELLTERARALGALGAEQADAVEALLLALDLEPSFLPASDLLRELENHRSGASRLFHVVVEVHEPVLGSSPAQPGLDGHFRSFRVIAESAEEAGEYALRHEQASFASVVSCEDRAPMPGELMGVVEAAAAARFTGS